jgi:hypothetical protein
MSVGYDKVSQRFVASQWYMIKVVRDFDRSVKIYGRGHIFWIGPWQGQYFLDRATARVVFSTDQSTLSLQNFQVLKTNHVLRAGQYIFTDLSKSLTTFIIYH